jgi:hypothetical protein
VLTLSESALLASAAAHAVAVAKALSRAKRSKLLHEHCAHAGLPDLDKQPATAASFGVRARARIRASRALSMQMCLRQTKIVR